MGNERYPRDNRPGDYYGGRDEQDYGRDYGSGRDYSYSSARDYGVGGELGGGREGYGRDRYGAGQGGRSYGAGDRDYRGGYASDGHRFAEPQSHSGSWDRDRHQDSRRGFDPRGHDDRHRSASHGSQSQGQHDDDRGFFDRAGDEVRSWFGDEEAERRRERDARQDAQSGGSWSGGGHHDRDYHSWRSSQMADLDRDYHEYRQENRSRFENEFSAWRSERQTQRDCLKRVNEHMDVVGSDGQHVGTVDKVRGDRIILTKNDADAGGHHHSIPSRWIQAVDDKVTIRKTADEAKRHWRDEEEGAMFGGDRSHQGARGNQSHDGGPHILDRSFSGTY